MVEDMLLVVIRSVYVGIVRGLISSRKRFPSFTHLHFDNGSEFINYGFVDWAKKQVSVVELSRSRAGKKNDNCYVEQKNFDTIRKLVGA